MNQFIFKSRWIAIGFAVLTLFSAYVIVNGLGGTAVPEVVESAEPAVEPADQGTSEPAAFDDSMDDAEFLDDEELIDDAGGDDPTPDDASAGDSGDDSNDFADSDGSVNAVNSGRPRYAPDGTPIVMTN